VDEALANIVAFVEGRMSPVAFESLAYHDPNIEAVLANDPTLRPDTYIGANTHLFVIQQDFASPSGILNVHGAMTQFLERRGIAFTPTQSHAELHTHILAAQPKWLDIPMDWLTRNVLPAAAGRNGRVLRDWLRQQFLERFRCAGKPPKWIQNPDWPIGDSGPLVFMGQVQIPNYFHDEAAAYVFHDPATGRCETVIQVA